MQHYVLLRSNFLYSTAAQAAQTKIMSLILKCKMQSDVSIRLTLSAALLNSSVTSVMGLTGVTGEGISE